MSSTSLEKPENVCEENDNEPESQEGVGPGTVVAELGGADAPRPSPHGQAGGECLPPCVGLLTPPVGEHC